MAKYLKEIRIRISYIYGGDDWYSYMTTDVRTILKKQALIFFYKTISDDKLIQMENDDITASRIASHLRENILETTGTLGFFPYKIKFERGYDSGKSWAFSDYYYQKKDSLLKFLRAEGLKF